MPSKKIFNIDVRSVFIYSAQRNVSYKYIFFLTRKLFFCPFSKPCEKHWGRAGDDTRCYCCHYRNAFYVHEIILMKLSCIIIRFRSFGVWIHTRASGLVEIEKLIPHIYSPNMWNDSHRFHYTAKVFAGSAFIIRPGIYIMKWRWRRRRWCWSQEAHAIELCNTYTQADEIFSLHFRSLALSLSPLRSQWIFIIDESIRSWCKQHKHTQATHKVDNHWIKCVNVFMKHSKLPPFFWSLCRSLRITKIRWDLFCFMRLLLVNTIANKSAAYSVFFSSSLRWLFTVNRVTSDSAFCECTQCTH